MTILREIINRRLSICIILSVLALLVSPIFGYFAVSIFIGSVFAALVFFEITIYLKDRVPFGHIMLLSYFFQIFLVSLFLFYFPANNSFVIDHIEYANYIYYIMPAIILLYLGFTLGTRNKSIISNQLSSDWSKRAEWLIFLGLIFLFIPYQDQMPTSLSFVIMLLANLRWVGLLSLVLQKNKRWIVYGVILFSLELISALSYGMFTDLIVWSSSFLFVLLYAYKQAKLFIPIAILSIVLLFLVQTVKIQYRTAVSQYSNSPIESALILKDMIQEELTQSITTLDMVSVSNNLTRFNQGWLVNSVFDYVPTFESFGKGKILLQAGYSLVPRVFDSQKPIAGGREIIEQYTGIVLNEGTSMNISVMGDFYADFGRIGMVICLFLFGYVFGWIYNNFYNLSLKSTAWWAWFPYIFYYAFKSEEGIMEILNWTVKSLVVVVFIVIIFNILSQKSFHNETV